MQELDRQASQAVEAQIRAEEKIALAHNRMKEEEVPFHTHSPSVCVLASSRAEMLTSCVVCGGG